MSGHCGAPEKSCGSECAQRRVIKLDAGKHQAACGEPSSVRPKLAGFWPSPTTTRELSTPALAAVDR